MNFVALKVISELDDIYFNTINNEPLKDIIFGETEEKSGKPKITRTTKQIRENISETLTLKWKIARAAYKVEKFFFASYFYFAPFSVLIVAFYSKKADVV